MESEPRRSGERANSGRPRPNELGVQPLFHGHQVQFLHMQRFCGCGQGWLVQAYAHSFGGGTGGFRLAVGRISESGSGRLSGVEGSGSVAAGAVSETIQQNAESPFPWHSMD